MLLHTEETAFHTDLIHNLTAAHSNTRYKLSSSIFFSFFALFFRYEPSTDEEEEEEMRQFLFLFRSFLFFAFNFANYIVFNHLFLAF